MKVPKDIADSVHDLVATGVFPDSDTVLREAMQLLKDQQEDQRFLESIEQARRSRAEGRSLPWNEETINWIWEEGLEMARRGIPPNPDVCPE